MGQVKKFDLEDRLIDFAIEMSEIVESLPSTKFANHIGGQLIRAGSSPALNYGEAQSAESPNDFIHKLKVILKEIRESRVCVKMISRKKLLPNNELQESIDECNELIAIFLKSIDTARKNRDKKNNKE